MMRRDAAAGRRARAAAVGVAALGLTAWLLQGRGGGGGAPPAPPLPAFYAEVKQDIAALVREKRCGPILIRLSWHDAGTFDRGTKTGGPRACMRFGGGESAHGANAGLQVARDLLEPIKAKHTAQALTYADLWSLAAATAVEEMGGPAIQWRPGRSDASSAEDSAPDGRLPDATKGPAHLREVFGRMGLSDRDIVALSGAHTVGAAHADRSGFKGAWTSAPLRFDNSYFTELLQHSWDPAKSPNGATQFASSRPSPTGDTMMLHSDVALLTDPAFRLIVAEYAADESAFFADFAAAFRTLQELGVTFPAA